MKPITESRTTSTSDLDSVSFGISEKDVPQILDVLRSGLYTDKIGAILREYGANAWDANRMVGRGDRPISIHIPTREDLELRIRDYGPGLSKDDVVNIYTKYGASTKRDTNDAVGSMGLGAKSGFAYADQFTITSWSPNTDSLTVGNFPVIKCVYVAVLDESGLGKMSLMDESFSSEETGVMITIATRPSDLWSFQNKAILAYAHYEPRPDINIELPQIGDRTMLTNGTITDSGEGNSKWIAVMGCVPYRLDLEQLDQSKLAKCLTNLSGSVFFSIGDVAVSASREELRYTERTKAAIIQKLNDLVDEYVIHALKELEDPTLSGWDKRLKLQVLTEMGLPLPEEYKEMANTYVKVKYDPNTCNFQILHNGSVCNSITVSSKTRLIMQDTDKPLKHYVYLTHTDYIVKGDRAELEAALKASGLDGIKISLLSAEYYEAPYKKPSRTANPKHRVSMFQLDPNLTGFDTTYTMSDNWLVISHVPTVDDVYVVLDAFSVRGNASFYRVMKVAKDFSTHTGEPLPAIYGYKSTKRKPVDEASLVGIKFEEWYKEWVKEMVVKYADKMELACWEAVDSPNCNKSSYAFIVEKLGENHIICQTMKRATTADIDGSFGFLRDYWLQCGNVSEASKAFQYLDKKYPLLRNNELSNLWYKGYYDTCGDTKREAWVDYVKMIDERDAYRHLIPVDADLVLTGE